ncbi:oxidoreductase, zinc-binding dehydrogenase family protein [Parvularcula bermudensis HTCC2503]|uniref:Oxidoreductase, zinc-binding dehydrogenase family protein n=1 Tax=Parvularcula bermudensis (strain ATCC BAA-594 / HTCC2503 / KCTC 12087) TaxID=314260 RepID=E0TBL2_PARBH|nr:NAD(P)-dependent alcohol dehydrogenase [Parvularcula bermudensis]ADM08387.1 oxidoreductase, zinc-binding dehydrogenase family protein [Parvularcula bermudensis HTCC2503]
MRVMRLGSPQKLENLVLGDLDDPGAPAAGEVRVRIEASSLNFHDYSVVKGMLPTEDGRIPLSDGAGTVEAVGEGVTSLSVGDQVVSVFFPHWQDGAPAIGDFSTTPGDGVDGYARTIVNRPATWFTKTPKGWSAAESATLTTAGLTAWRALFVDGSLKAGDTLLCLGTGGVSIFALQFAKAVGARVAMTSSSDEKLAKTEEMGADFTVNYKSNEKWGKAVAQWTGGTGVDHVIEVGGPATLSQSITATRIGGHIHLIGVLTGIQGEIPTANMMRKQITLQGLIVGNHRQQRDMIKAIDATGLKPVIDKTFDLSELASAFQYEADGKHFGKIAISI